MLLEGDRWRKERGERRGEEMVKGRGGNGVGDGSGSGGELAR